jgi:WD40 repeat protein
VSSDAELLAIVEDSEKFLLRFFDAIESSATHIYDSALPLSPSSSLVRAQYVGQISTDVKISGIEESWDACMRTIQLRNNVDPMRFSAIKTCMTFSHKDDLIAVSGGNVVNIFETATGQLRTTLTDDRSNATSLAFSPDILVTGNNDGGVYVWDLQTGGLVDVLEGHTNRIRSLVFSPCGAMIATSSDDRTIRIWTAFSLDCRCVLEGHSDAIRTVCWSATGSEVISGSDDTTVKVWSISGKKCSKTFTVHSGLVNFVASSPNSSLIASGSEDRTLKVYDSQTGDVLHTILWFSEFQSSNQGHAVRFLDQDQIMYTTNKTFVIRDLTKKADVVTFEHEGHIVAISSDGSRLASSQDGVGVVKIWQTNRKQSQGVTAHHSKGVCCMFFSGDGQMVASGSEDKTAKVWDTSTGQCLTTFRGHSSVVRMAKFSPDSTLCASWAWNDDIWIWNVHTGNPISNLGHHSHVLNLCFSPDGNQLTWAQEGSGPDGHVQVRSQEVATGDCFLSIGRGVASGAVPSMSLDVDGSHWLGLLMRNTETRWSLYSAPESSRAINTNIRSRSSPMVVLHALPRNSTHVLSSYHHDWDNSWILDQQERRMLWEVPDWQCYLHGTKVVFTSTSGRVIIADFRT